VAEDFDTFLAAELGLEAGFFGVLLGDLGVRFGVGVADDGVVLARLAGTRGDVSGEEGGTELSSDDASDIARFLVMALSTFSVPVSVSLHRGGDSQCTHYTSSQRR